MEVAIVTRFPHQLPCCWIFFLPPGKRERCYLKTNVLSTCHLPSHPPTSSSLAILLFGFTSKVCADFRLMTCIPNMIDPCLLAEIHICYYRAEQNNKNGDLYSALPQPSKVGWKSFIIMITVMAIYKHFTRP